VVKCILTPPIIYKPEKLSHALALQNNSWDGTRITIQNWKGTWSVAGWRSNCGSSDIISANNYKVNIIPLLQNIKLQNMQPMSPLYFTSFPFSLYHVDSGSLQNKSLILRFLSFCVLMYFSFGHHQLQRHFQNAETSNLGWEIRLLPSVTNILLNNVMLFLFLLPLFMPMNIYAQCMQHITET